MPRGWPPLELREVIAILAAFGIHYSHSSGGHDFYVGFLNGQKRKVTVDPKYAPFDAYLLSSMCAQAGLGRKEFYGATKGTAAKIGVKFHKTDEPA
jgi:hypothetical protein